MEALPSREQRASGASVRHVQRGRLAGGWRPWHSRLASGAARRAEGRAGRALPFLQAAAAGGP
eukprot:scaffold7226_cov387-Prasinococcus_capsulatus_cf.AAC.1